MHALLHADACVCVFVCVCVCEWERERERDMLKVEGKVLSKERKIKEVWWSRNVRKNERETERQRLAIVSASESFVLVTIFLLSLIWYHI
jgi:hypothetical protein